MADVNKPIFINLFKDACLKCFGFSLDTPLTETDSKLLSNTIFEHTGLVIGAKSIKNYSIYVFNSNRKETGSENPSVATLDTLARYVLDAPYTDEVQRKDKESHYPYWFQYRSRFSGNSRSRKTFRLNRKMIIVFFILTLAVVTGAYLMRIFNQRSTEFFMDDFNSLDEDTLAGNGWKIISKDTSWWNKRNEKPGHLALYSLRGDNWSLGDNRAGIKNLLIREINSDCFVVEVHLTNFIPRYNWQQAGIILSEDSAFKGKMIRLSFSYNDFFGGYEKPAEIILQAISSSEIGIQSKPEEIVHLPLFSIEPGKKSLAESNLAKSALKIEKNGNHFRFLYSVAPIESFAFKEAAGGDFNMTPKYVSIFSIKGWSDKENFIPAYFDSFRMINIKCVE